MRRYAALMAQLRAQPREGSTLHFENCTGGFFSSDPKYALCVKGQTEIRSVLANPNVFPLGDLDNMIGWAFDEFDYSDQVLSMLEPRTTYTLSFEAECVSRPAPTTQCDYEHYIYNPETGEGAYVPCYDSELPLKFNHGGLGFAMVHEYAEDGSGYQIDIPDNETFPTIPMYVWHELKNGEKYRGVVTFTTPGGLGGYHLCILTNQFYYSHRYTMDGLDYMDGYPEAHCSCVTFRNIKIEEGTVATGYYGPYGQEVIPEEIKYVESGTAIICGNDRFTVPCELREGDVWYPATGQVIKADGSEVQYSPHTLIAPCGTFSITQEARDAKAIISATLLAKSPGGRNQGWSWYDIQGIVRAGLASQVFDIGDQLTVRRNGTDIVFDVIGIDHDVPTDANYRHSLTLQTHDIFWQPTPFDAKKALYYAQSDLSPGTYNFTTPVDYESGKGNNNKTYSFVISKAIPTGGIITLTWPYNQSLTNSSTCWLTSYASKDVNAEPLEDHIVLAEVQSGTALGIADGTDRPDTLNHIGHARYGQNIWELSTIRKYLNSDTSKGDMWTPNDQFDLPPAWSTSNKDGFLFGFDEAFLSVLGQVNKTTAQIAGQGGGLKTMPELIFLPSADEVYGGIVNKVPEGTAYAYYAHNSTLSTPSTSNDAGRVKLLQGNAKYWYLRTPLVSSIINEKVVNQNGQIVDTSASTAYFAAPVCCIV